MYIYSHVHVHVCMYMHILLCMNVFSPKYNLLNLYNVCFQGLPLGTGQPLGMFFPFHFGMLLVSLFSSLVLVRCYGCSFFVGRYWRGWFRGDNMIMLVKSSEKDVKYRCRHHWLRNTTKHEKLESTGTRIFPSVVKKIEASWLCPGENDYWLMIFWTLRGRIIIKWVVIWNACYRKLLQYATQGTVPGCSNNMHTNLVASCDDIIQEKANEDFLNHSFISQIMGMY